MTANRQTKLPFKEKAYSTRLQESYLPVLAGIPAECHLKD